MLANIFLGFTLCLLVLISVVLLDYKRVHAIKIYERDSWGRFTGKSSYKYIYYLCNKAIDLQETFRWFIFLFILTLVFKTINF
jgi:hypothetical protein